MNDLIEYRNNYLKKNWIDFDSIITMSQIITLHILNFWFKFKSKITEIMRNIGDTKAAEIALLLKHLSNFWGIFEKPLINWELNFILASSENCDHTTSTTAVTFATTDTKH